MKITGKISSKLYQCVDCSYKENHSTNHYGSIYIRCNQCSWKSPMSPIKVFTCLEMIPDGWDKPKEWEIVKLGEIATVI